MEHFFRHTYLRPIIKMMESSAPPCSFYILIVNYLVKRKTTSEVKRQWSFNFVLYKAFTVQSLVSCRIYIANAFLTCSLTRLQAFSSLSIPMHLCFVSVQSLRPLTLYKCGLVLVAVSRDQIIKQKSKNRNNRKSQIFEMQGRHRLVFNHISEDPESSRSEIQWTVHYSNFPWPSRTTPRDPIWGLAQLISQSTQMQYLFGSAAWCPTTYLNIFKAVLPL